MALWEYPLKEDPIFRHLAVRTKSGVYHHRAKPRGSDQYKPISLRTKDLDEARAAYLEVADDPVIENRKVTCQQAFDEWVVRLRERGRSSSTIRRYECAWENDIQQHFARRPVCEITPKDVLRVLDVAKKRVSPRTKQKLSPDSLYQIHATMSALFAFCAQPTNGYCSTNPSAVLGEDKPSMPRVSKVASEVIFDEQAMDDLAEQLGEGTWQKFQRKVIVLLSPEIGTRIGETLALQLPDVDMLRKRLKIQRQLAFYKDRVANDPTTWFKDLKGEDSRIGDKKRTVPLSPFAADLLQRYIDRGFAEGRLRPGGLLFPSKLGTPLAATRISAHLRKAGKTMGRTVRAHYFRHTYASTLVSGGTQLEHAAAFLGHDPEMTRKRYGHFVPDDSLFEQVGNLGRQVKEATS